MCVNNNEDWIFKKMIKDDENGINNVTLLPGREWISLSVGHCTPFLPVLLRVCDEFHAQWNVF